MVQWAGQRHGLRLILNIQGAAVCQALKEDVRSWRTRACRKCLGLLLSVLRHFAGSVVELKIPSTISLDDGGGVCPKIASYSEKYTHPPPEVKKKLGLSV